VQIKIWLQLPVKNYLSLHRSWNIDCELVTPEEAQKLCPLIAVDDLQGGLWIPGDGVGDPYQICLSLISAAREGGKKPAEIIILPDTFAITVKGPRKSEFC
jgi:glycine/D-amino acid oxidase-like deaminating enzyme